MLFQVKFLALTAQVKADEMAEMFQGKLALDLKLEREWAVAIGSGLLPHLDNHFSSLGLGEDQLPPHREEIISLRQGVGSILLIRRKGAGLPNPSDLQMQMITFTASGVNHPEVRLIQGNMPPNQGEHTTKHHGFKLNPLGIGQRAAGELLGVGWGVSAAHETDGPVLQRLCDRGNRMGAH